MKRYGLAKRAVADLYDIFLYGYEQFGEKQAEAYAEDLDHVFQLLADNPRLGRKAPTIAEGVRRHEHGSHVILYEDHPGGVTILAVVHARSVRRLAL
jgi:toxin ParE1/3/4